MKKMISVVLAFVIGCGVCAWMGYNTGITNATTSDGWIDEDERGTWFVLEVDGNYYEWGVDVK